MKTINKLFHSLLVLILCLGSVSFLHSCKDDDETLINQFYDFPEMITCKIGDEVTFADMKFGEDTMVVPAVVLNLRYAVENSNILASRNGTLYAVGLGSTEIFIYNEDDELIRTIPVIVESSLEFLEHEENPINLKYGDELNLVSNYANYEEFKLCSFTTSDKSVLTVDRDGNVKAVGLGTADVTIYVGNQEYKTYNFVVSPNYTITMTQGQVSKITDLISEISLGQSYYLDPVKSGVVAVTRISTSSSIILTAMGSGDTVLKNSYYVIAVTVTPASLQTLFDMDFLVNTLKSSMTSLTVIKEKMKDYDLIAEGPLNDQGLSSTYSKALRYAPFGDAKSITFYFDGYGYYKTCVIETGKTSEEVCGWLINNCASSRIDRYTGEFSAFQPVLNIYSDEFYAVDGSWSTIQYK